MKLSATLLPADAAALLEAQLPMLDAIERAPTAEERDAALATTRSWLMSTASTLRQQDARYVTKANPVPAPKAAAASPAKKPCDCDKQPVKSAGQTLGERLARKALETFFPASR